METRDLQALAVLWFCFWTHQQVFKNKPRSHPEGGVIQPDDAFNICPRFAVVPGADFIFFQDATADIFTQENENAIAHGAHSRREIFD